MASTLRELVSARENDYGDPARRYRRATGGDLVTDPFDSSAHGPERLTRSASVLIGARNSERSLVPVLVALEHCTFNRSHPDLLQVIVVDDGSTDETRTTLLGLELDLRWLYVRQSRGGLTCAHNTGLSYADGDVIVFCDADVVQHPRALEELMKRHQVLDGVTLLGFRFDVDPADPRLGRDRLPEALKQAVPAFWRDFRVAFPGWPANMCRDTGHLRDLGCGRRLWMANGAGYDLAAMVVGAFFSIEREQLLAIGASDERLVGWGCEDSLIGARSLALGNAVVPVYPAVGWHIWHPRRDPAEQHQFRRNLATLEHINEEPFTPTRPDLQGLRARASEVIERRRASSARRAPEDSPPAFDHLTRAAGYEAVGRYADALAAYDRAAGCAEKALGQARCWRAVGERELALGAAEQATVLAPDSGEAALALALALADAGGFAEARLALEKQRRGDAPPFEPTWALDTTAEAHKLRGNRHARQGLNLIAVTDFALALIADPTYAWAHFDRALAFRQLDRPTEALESMRWADNLLHRRDGNRTWVHSALASLHSALGRPITAAAQLDRALALYPDNHEALGLSRELPARRDTSAVSP